MDKSDQIDMELKRLSKMLCPRITLNQYAVFLKIKRILELLADGKMVLEWIDVNDRMPDQPDSIIQVDQYWCALENGSCHLVKFAHTTSGRHEFIWNTMITSKITHWMYLPSHPKESLIKE